MSLNVSRRHRVGPNSRFLVDNFKVRQRHASGTDLRYTFFLTHFHADHYGGLDASWPAEWPIYTGALTIDLCELCLGVDRRLFRPLSLTSPTEVVDPASGALWMVECSDANHCPGALVLLFTEVASGAKYVHSGDMRYTPTMKTSALQRFAQGASRTLYLDSTYANPKYLFAPQAASVEYVGAAVLALREEQTVGPGGSKTLVLVSTYVIGKERVLLAAAQALGCKIFSEDERKRRILRLVLTEMLGSVEDADAMITGDPRESDLHVLGWQKLGETFPYFRADWAEIGRYLDKYNADRAVGFLPTGWMGTGSENTRQFKTVENPSKTVCIHLVPYSEHSTYTELCEFLDWMRPKAIEPTVVGSGPATMPEEEREKERRKKRRKLLELFSPFIDAQDAKRTFIGRMSTRGTSASALPHGEPETLTPGAADQEEKEDSMGEVQVLDVVDLRGHGGTADRAPGAARHEASPTATALMASMVEQPSAEGVASGRHEAAATALEEASPADQVLDALVQDLLGIVGQDALTEAQARVLLRRSGMNLEAALGAFFDGGAELKAAPAATDMGTSPASQEPVEPASAPTPKRQKRAKPAPPSPAKRSPFRKPLGPQQQTLWAWAGVEPPSRLRRAGRQTGGSPGPNKKRKLGEPTGAAVFSDARSAPIPVRALDEEPAKPASPAKPTQLPGAPAASISGALAARESSIAARGRGSAEHTVAEGATTKDAASGESLANGATPVDPGVLLTPPEKYDPTSDYPFRSPSGGAKASSAPYLFLSMLCEHLEKERGRIKKDGMLINYFRSLLLYHPDDVLCSVYLLTNHIAPASEGIDLNIGGGVVSQAVSEVSGVPRARLRDLYRELGDMGDVAQAVRQRQSTLLRPKMLTIQHVYTSLRGLSTVSGNGSTARRKAVLLRLLRACRETETRMLVRTFLQHVRTGAVLKTVLANLARAVCLSQSFGDGRIGARDYIMSKRVLTAAAHAMAEGYSLCPNLELCVPKLMEKREWTTDLDLGFGANLRVGMPLKPMLAKMQSTYAALFKTFGDRPFLAEWKYDGMRAQIHIRCTGTRDAASREVRIFTRNSEDCTDRFPTATQAMLASLPEGDAIVDAEVVAVDRSESPPRLLPFQTLARRPKGNAQRPSRGAAATPLADAPSDVCLFLFDLLYYQGESLLARSFRERRDRLRAPETLVRQPGLVELAEGVLVGEPGNSATTLAERAAGGGGADDGSHIRAGVSDGDGAGALVETAMEQSMARGCEGLMCKLLDGEASAYAPSKRSDAWLKLKKDYIEGIADSLDLVPIGAWYGNGRKAGWYSPFLLAAFDPTTGTFQSVCRVLSGFTDEFYTKKTGYYSGRVLEGKKAGAGADATVPGAPEPENRLLARKPAHYLTGEQCPVWFEASEVWTIRGAEFSVSPTHMCAYGLVAADRTRGLALRFPRFLHERPDKALRDATTPREVLDLYEQQVTSWAGGNGTKVEILDEDDDTWDGGGDGGGNEGRDGKEDASSGEAKGELSDGDAVGTEHDR